MTATRTEGLPVCDGLDERPLGARARDLAGMKRRPPGREIDGILAIRRGRTGKAGQAAFWTRWRGTMKVKVAPFPFSEVTWSWPPCITTIPRQMASPRPAPPA